MERPLPLGGRTQAAGPLAGLTGLTRGPPGSGCCSEKRRLGFGFRFSSASFITSCVALETVSPFWSLGISTHEIRIMVSTLPSWR